MTIPKTRSSSDTKIINPVQRVKLLSRVAAYYHRNFLDNPEGLRYLTKERGLRDVTLVKQFQIGLANGSLLEILPINEETLSQLTTLGVLTSSRHELLNGVVFPMWGSDGTVINLYGRRMFSGDVNHLYLPNAEQGFWNIPAIKRSPSILVTRSILDALTAIDNGLPETIPCDYINGFSEEHLQFFKKCGVKRMALAFKPDDAGLELAKKIVPVLKANGFAIATVTLPEGHDVNSYLTGQNAEDTKKAFHAKVGEAFTSASKETDGGTQVTVAVPGEIYEHTESGFNLTLRERRYKVLGITRETTQLKVVIKAWGDRHKSFELTVLDLFSSRSRERYMRECMALFSESESVIKADINRVVECVEAWQPKDIDAPILPIASAEETACAMAFLQSPTLVDEILADLQILGVAGEELNKLLCYIAVVSRKLDDPLSLLIQSRSAAGKSTLQRAVLALTPDEDQATFTRLTPQALYYNEEKYLTHKVLALEEAEGLGNAAYSLRSLQSEKKLSISTTIKDPISGKLKSVPYLVKGPVAVLLTTTSASLDEETASRFLTLTIDESRQMTETILTTQRHRDTLKGYLGELEKAAVIKKHHTAQRLLEPFVVINNYADQLTFPVHNLRARRDHNKYLMLIKAVTFLHQKQRQVKTGRRGDQEFSYLTVTTEDIRLANKLALHVLGHSVDELSTLARELLRQIYSMVKTYCSARNILETEYKFTRRHIRQEIGWTDFQVRTHIEELQDLAYLKVRDGGPGKEYVYELVWDGKDDVSIVFTSALVDPDSLEERE